MLRNVLLGLILSLFVGLLFHGGAERIGRVSSFLVPLASSGYFLLCFIFLIFNRSAVPAAFRSIVHGAFYPRAVTGGMIGSVFSVLRTGCARGVFTNEAGMGTASMIYASSQVSHPVEQGMLGLLEVFLDTIVICSLTAFVILCSGVPIPYGKEAGVILTVEAFSSCYGSWVAVLLTFFLCTFAFATMIGWGMYGARCAQFLFGVEAWEYFSWIQIVFVVISTVISAEFIWKTAEILNGFMAIPNLIALSALSPELVQLVKEYKKGG